MIHLLQKKKGEQNLFSVAETNKPSEMISGISEDVMDALVRTLLPDIIRLCESEESKAIFEKLKAEHSE